MVQEQQSKEPVTFLLSEPPSSTPATSASGRPIKAKVIRAMEEQLKAENQASSALDRMIAVLRETTGLPTPVPARGEK
jgi:hypothetical protein